MPGHEYSGTGSLSVRLLELRPLAIMLCTLEPDEFGEHDMKTLAGRQVSGSVATLVREIYVTSSVRQSAPCTSDDGRSCQCDGGV